MLTSIISAIGNNNSIYPLLIRDCGIENPTKVYMTYKQNKSDKFIAKNAVRERIIDEYVTSAVWLGGIPLVGKICDKFIKNRGFDPVVSMDLLKNDPVQNIRGNIDKFKSVAPDAVKDLLKVENNQALYKKLSGIKLLSSIVIPTVVMGFVLPKLNFALTKKMMKKPADNQDNFVSIQEFEKIIKNKKEVSFGSGVFNALNNLSTVQKMAITDTGLSVGRVSTARNKNEALDNGIKMAGMMYLNYVAPKQIAKGLDNISEKLFKLNVGLDPVILADKEFIKAIKSKNIKFPATESAKDVLDFIDKNPKELLSSLAQKLKLVKMVDNTTRDPRAFVDVKEVNNFIKAIKDFSEKANKSGNIDEFVKKAKTVKSVNILANVVISSFLLAFCLPKVQFILRKLITKNKYEPGLVDKKSK